MRALAFLAAAVAALSVPAALADGPARGPTLGLVPQPDPASPPPGSVRPATPPAAGQTDVAPPPSQATQRAVPLDLPGGIQANVPTSFVLYSAPEAQAYLQRIGAAVPSGQVAGLLAPVGKAPTDADFWGAVVTYTPLGYVAEDGSSAVSQTGFIDDVRAARGAAAPRLEAFEVLPVYSSAADTLVWAERTAASGGQTRTVTYSQRLLGREGVAKLDAHLRPDQLAEARAVGPAMLSVLSFPAGRRHGDYVRGDRLAEYDVPGLISGAKRSAAQAVSAAGDGGGGGGGLPGWAPWAAIGAAVAAAGAWLAFLVRRRDRDDPNLTPS